MTSSLTKEEMAKIVKNGKDIIENLKADDMVLVKKFQPFYEGLSDEDFDEIFRDYVKKHVG